MSANQDDDRGEETSVPEPKLRKAIPSSRGMAASQTSRSFEQAIAEVEEIVAKLEGGRLGLSQSLDEYQRGVGTLKECYEILEVAERRVTLLSGFDAEGNPVTETFEEDVMSIQEKQVARSTRRSAPKTTEQKAGPGPKAAPRTGLSHGGDADDHDSQDGLF